MTTVSIIMPVYNPGEFLHIAIEGILNQTYKDLELICINDASTDSSQDMLLQYTKQDSRVRLHVNRYNCGAAYSRNIGITLARGKYIFFVDADDVFDETLIENLVTTAIQENSDMVYVAYDIFKGSHVGNVDNRHRYFFFSKVLSLQIKSKDHRKAFLRDMQMAPYSRLYKKEFIENNRLRFQELRSSNDVYFGTISALLSDKIAHTEEYVHLIHVREHDSVSRISNNRNPFDNFKAYKYIKDQMHKREIWDGYKIVIQERFLMNSVYEITVCDRTLSRSYYYFLKEQGFEEMETWDILECEEADSACKNIARSFGKEEFESGWYYKIDYFMSLLQDNSERVKKLFSQLQISKKRYAIWGAGIQGKMLADFCEKYDYDCIGVIDNDSRKQGNLLCKYQIYSPEDILDRIDAVIITNQNYFNEIYDQICQNYKNVEMISLEIYMLYQLDLEESSLKVGEKRK